VPKQVGGTEFVQAMTEQVWPPLQPVVMGGLPRTVQREVSSSCVLAVVSTLGAVPSPSLAAEHPNAPSALIAFAASARARRLFCRRL